jgi:Protein of unknown function (DUF1688)
MSVDGQPYCVSAGAPRAIGTAPTSMTGSPHSLLTPLAVRERAREVLGAGLDRKLDSFSVVPERLPHVADLVAGVIRDNYPSLAVPLHARWRHFVVAGNDLWEDRAQRTRWADAAAKARAAFDLAVVSVLLDAGAGADWRYVDAATGAVVGRSEGLALASLRMFEAGAFSARATDPLRADADRLAAFTAEELAHGLQVSAANPLVGLEGRAAVIAKLGVTVAATPSAFSRLDTPRPGGLFDALVARCADAVLPAARILEVLLVELGPVWPGRIRLAGVPLGDTWRHPAIKRDGPTDGLVPLHKLAQWLAYSLIEPMQRAGIQVSEIDALTGLAEYRNGGLFVDSGVLRLKDPAAANRAHQIDSLLVVEWRALTVALIDRILPLVRDRLGLGADAFPLARLLQGGTWVAGRRLAQQMRPDASPPIRVISDGTVF